MVDGKFAADKKILHVFDDQSAARHFAETREYVLGLRMAGGAVGASDDFRNQHEEERRPHLLQDDAGLFDFVSAQSGEFVSTYGIFDSKRFSPYFLNKKTFRVSVGDKLDERALVSKLLTFLYAFQEYSADPWTYRRDGDNVTVRTSRERVMVSFFDGEVDSISIGGTLGGKPVSAQTFVFPDRTQGERLVDSPDNVSAAAAE